MSEEDPPFPDYRHTLSQPGHVDSPNLVQGSAQCRDELGGGRLHHWLVDVPQHLEKWASCISHGKSQTSLTLLICAPKGRIWLGSGGISEIKSLLRKQGFQQSWEIQR